MRMLVVATSLLLVLGLAVSRPVVQAEELTISGVVWDDKNADGVRQPGEPGFGGLALTLSPAPESPFGSRFIRLNNNGEYSVTVPAAGNYVITIEGRFNPYFQTYPIRVGGRMPSQSVNVSTSAVKNVDFGLYFPVDAMTFTGSAWADGTALFEPYVRAYIDGVDCTSGYLLPADGGGYGVRVVSAALVPGCGEPGKTIRFTLNDRPADQVATWEAKSSRTLELTAGAFHAYFLPEVFDPATLQRDFQTPHRIDAFVDGKLCGTSERFGMGGVLLAVPSREQVPGCGYDGAPVSFSLDGVMTEQVMFWGARSFEGPDIPLASTSAAIVPPNAGDGGLSH